MKVRFHKTTWRTLGAVAACCVLVVSFQNCGKAGFDSSLDNGINVTSTDAALSAKYGDTVAALVSAIPFAFDSGFDTISYNSCANSSLTGNSAFYSIKAGAYETMGVKLADGFFTYMDANFHPNYPATTLSSDQYSQYLGDSPANSAAVPNMAIRSKANLFNVYSSSSSVTLGTDVISMVSSLTDPLVMDTYVVKTGTASPYASYYSYFPFSAGNRTLEGTLTFNADEGTAAGFRNVLNNDGELSLTYLQSTSDPNLIRAASTTTPVKTAYGRAYKTTFTWPSGVSSTSSSVLPANTIGTLQEIDLSSSSITYNWNCNRKYKVVRAADRATYCPALTWAQISDATVRREVEIARHVLNATDWDVNPSYGCVVPKGSVSCYDEETLNGTAVGVNYDPSQQCYNPLVGASGYTGGVIPSARCAQYITICTRY